MGVVFYNGDFKDERDVFVSSNSRAFNYGDGFFETVKVINSKPFNFPCHIDRIKFALSTLKISDNYTSAFFEDKFSFLLKANKVVNGSIKIHISRNGIGRYLPESNKSDLFISVVNGLAYKKNNPISLCFYDKQFKAIGTLSNIKSSNSLVSVLASIHAFENNYDNAILINHSAKVIESANANIFILKDKYIYTPPISDRSQQRCGDYVGAQSCKISKRDDVTREGQPATLGAQHKAQQPNRHNHLSLLPVPRPSSTHRQHWTQQCCTGGQEGTQEDLAPYM